ncbi:MAG: hypothetical protein ACFFDN_52775 [Candidatus Hodarchaeota archaeon]
MGKASYEDLVKLLSLLGGIIAIIEAIFTIAGRSVQRYYYLGWIAAIIALIFGILVLFSVIKPDNPIPYNWIYLIVFGIVIIACGSLIGGILVLIAGILKLIFENME